MDADRGVARAGAARHQQHPGFAGELAVSLGHKRSTALLAAGDEMDLRGVVKRIEHFEIALTGDAEGHLDPMRPQRSDDQLAAAACGEGSPPSPAPRRSWTAYLRRCTGPAEGVYRPRVPIEDRIAARKRQPAKLRPANAGIVPACRRASRGEGCAVRRVDCLSWPRAMANVRMCRVAVDSACGGAIARRGRTMDDQPGPLYVPPSPPRPGDRTRAGTADGSS